MKTRAELFRMAAAMDFRPEVLEKVHRLLAMQARISRQPMLLWKQMHVRKHLGLDAE